MTDPKAVPTQEDQAMAVDDLQVAETTPAPAPAPTGEAVSPAAAVPELPSPPTAEPSTNLQGSADVQVFQPSSSNPSGSSSTPVPDDFFEPTIADVQRYQTSIAGRSQQLNDGPLLTSKFRDAEKAAKEKAKATKWPTATIRIKFSDGTQIQSTFPSTSPIQPVYEFIRSSLSADVASKDFVLAQPPNILFPERPVPPTHPVKKPINPKMKAHVITPSNYGPVRGASTKGGTGGKESLSDLGLVPQSMLIVRWEEAEMNSSAFPAPIKEELRARAAPLPDAQPKDTAPEPAGEPAKKRLTGNAGDVKMPKWLAKGLMKKKT